MNNRFNLIFWGVVAAIALVVGGFFGVRSIVRARAVAPFKPHVAAYLTQPAGAPPADGKAAIKGKVITVDRKGQEVDYLYFDLPEEMRAGKPEEVGTVVWLDWDKTQVGQYDDGTPGYVQTCQVTVIDKGANAVVGKNAFRGGDPPKSKKKSESGMGPKPTDEIVKYLTSLPRS
jgi:hypothetical protein